jgi:hypothetical protein
MHYGADDHGLELRRLLLLYGDRVYEVGMSGTWRARVEEERLVYIQMTRMIRNCCDSISLQQAW